MKKSRQARDSLDRTRGKSRFIYQQLAAMIRRQIEEGLFKPGDMLPSMDLLAERHRVNKATVRQALSEITANGLIYTIPAKGTFVADPAQRKPQKPAGQMLSLGWISMVSGHQKTGRYHTEMMDAVRTELPGIKGQLTVITAEEGDMAFLVQQAGQAHLDGAILVGPFYGASPKPLLDSGLPCVLIDDSVRGNQADSIQVDNQAGGHQAATHLLSLGHRRLAFITGPTDWKISQDRLAGAYEAMDEAGLPRERALIAEGDFSPESGYAACLNLLQQTPRPTALFAFNDEMAAGVLHALHEHSTLLVPADISVVGFDNISWAAWTHPPLTTIQVDKERMGLEAVARLYDAIVGKNHLPFTTLHAPHLIVRKSTASPPHA